VLVVGVTSGSPAAAAGVLVGDVVLDFDGRRSSLPRIFSTCSWEIASARAVPLKVLRGGAAVEFSVTVGERPLR
jgi:serine protease Do